MNITALAVIIDSAVTLGVGYWLNRTAKTSVKKAAEDIGPAIQEALETSAKDFTNQAKKEIAMTIQKVVPIIIKAMQKQNASNRKVGENCQQEPPILSVYKEHNTQTQIHPSDLR